MSRTAIALMSTENLLHNLRVIQKISAPAKTIAMLKANAYGHGIRSVGARLADRVYAFGVASIDEALALRKHGITTPILLMQGIFEPEELQIASEQDFQIVFNNEIQVGWLEKSSLSRPIHAWIKINTGMNRLGFKLDKAALFFERIQKSPLIQGPVKIISHFACADTPSHPLNTIQIHAFQNAIQDLTTEYSLCNSAGIFNFPDCHYDYVRPGIALYGVSPIPGKSALDLNLKPVMTLKTCLMAIQHLKKGDTVGYGAQYTCPENMPIGIIAFGYGDGYPFTARSGIPILINDRRCYLIGQVSMDMIAVDLRPYPQAQIGDTALLWGEGLPVEQIAAHTSNMNWDMLTSVQNRVKFIWT